MGEYVYSHLYDELVGDVNVAKEGLVSTNTIELSIPNLQQKTLMISLSCCFQTEISKNVLPFLCM